MTSQVLKRTVAHDLKHTPWSEYAYTQRKHTQTREHFILKSGMENWAAGQLSLYLPLF